MQRTVFGFALAFALVGFNVDVQAAATRKPNIVFILADDLGYGDVGPFGQKIIRTPTLDRMAAEGMKFTHHYAGSPVCAPSRCVLLTGKHPGHAYIRDNKEVGPFNSFQGQVPVPEGEVKLPELLKSLGYATAGFGKWGLGGVGTSGDPLKQGFDHFFGYNDQRHAHSYFPHFLVDDEGRLPLPENAHVFIQEKITLPADADGNDPANYQKFIGKQYGPDLCFERAAKFVRENRDRPFFLYYPTIVPHITLQVSEDSLAEYKGKLDDKPYRGGDGYLPQQFPHACYAAMITRMDRDIGRLMQLIKDLGLDDDTIFIFTSDNGAVYPLSGTDPEYFHSNAALHGYKGDIYEGGMREPLIVRWKGHVPHNRTSSFVCGFEDWIPTLLSLIDATNTLPKNLDGISFAPTILGKTQEPRPFLYREFHGYGGQQSIRVGDWKLLKRNLLDMPKKKAAPTIELYDLANDPAEKTNILSAHPEIVAKLESLMREQHVPTKLWPFPTLDKS